MGICQSTKPPIRETKSNNTDIEKEANIEIKQKDPLKNQLKQSSMAKKTNKSEKSNKGQKVCFQEQKLPNDDPLSSKVKFHKRREKKMKTQIEHLTRQSPSSNMLSPAKRDERRERKNNTIELKNKTKEYFNSILLIETNVNSARGLYEDYVLIKQNPEGKKFQAYSKILQKEVIVRQTFIEPDNKKYLLDSKSVEILQNVDHPFILNYIDYFVISNIHYVVREAHQISLLEKIKSGYIFNEQQCSFIAYQLIKVALFLQSSKIIHRNIKSKNVIISEMKDGLIFVKLKDFRRARIYTEGEKFSDFVGTSNFVAPEVIKENYDERIDMWGIGIILYQICQGKTPFESKDDESTYQEILEKNITFDPKKPISSELKDLIIALLKKDPDERISPEKALNHPFFEYSKLQEKLKIESKRMLNLIETLGCNKFLIRNNILRILSHNLERSKALIERQNLFLILDSDNDGVISENDIMRVYNEVNQGEFSAAFTEKLSNLTAIFKVHKTLQMKDFLFYSIDKHILSDNYSFLFHFMKKRSERFNLADMRKQLLSVDENDRIIEKMKKILVQFKVGVYDSIESHVFKQLIKKIIE